MNEKFDGILNSLVRVNLYKYEREKNPGKEFTRLYPKLLLRIEEEEKLLEIKNLFEIQNIADGSLRTTGSYYFEFESENGQKTEVNYLGRDRLRSAILWNSDAILKRPIELLKWLAKLGISEPLATEMRTQERYEKEKQKNKMIYSKIPSNLLDANGKLDMSNLKKDSKKLYQELIAKGANESIDFLNLFELLVLRSNNWWQTSVFEMLITKILLGVPFEFIEQTIESKNITLMQADGIARFLTCQEFQKHSSEEGIVISPLIKEKLFVFIQKLDDERKIQAYESKILQIEK